MGIPYEVRDCYGAVVDFYKQVFDIELKNYYDQVPTNRDIAKNLIYSSLGDFEKVEGEMRFGDILLIKMMGVESHIAIFIGEGRIFHSTSVIGSCMDRFVRWEKLVVGVYRVKETK